MVTQSCPEQTRPSSLEVIRAIYDAVALRDLEGALIRLSPHIVVTQSSALPFGKIWRGHEGFRAMGAAIFAAWPDFAVVPERFLVDGDTVLVMTRVSGARRTATPLDQPMIERWRVADGVAVECQPFYFDPAAAALSAISGER